MAIKTHRMTWRRELRWLVATYLLGWAIDLMTPEMSNESLRNALGLFRKLNPDPKFDTVKMRRPFDDTRGSV